MLLGGELNQPLSENILLAYRAPSSSIMSVKRFINMKALMRATKVNTKKMHICLTIPGVFAQISAMHARI